MGSAEHFKFREVAEDVDTCVCGACLMTQNAVQIGDQQIEAEPQHVRPVFILSEHEQKELMDFLWPQWINPNDWPNLKAMMNRLEQAQDK